MLRSNRCPDCDGGLLSLGGDGKCSMCHGTGKNVHLNSDQAECEKCGGSGLCKTCGGTGDYRGSSDFTDLFLGRTYRSRAMVNSPPDLRI